MIGTIPGVFWIIGALLVSSFEPRVPVVGYVQTAGGELRVVTGLVGANVVGERVKGEMRAFAAPGNGLALVEMEGGIGVARLEGLELGAARAIGETAGGMERAVFSPGGRSAVVPVFAAGRMQVITGLPEGAKVVREVDFGGEAGAFLGVAVSDDGEVVLAAFGEGERARLVAFRGDGGGRTVMERGSIAAVRFVGGSHRALVADAVANEVVEVGEDGGVSVLAGAAEGVNGPADVETGLGGRRVLVANSGGNLLEIERETGKTRVISCGFAPFSLQRMKGSAVAVLGRDGGSIAVIDVDAELPWAAYAPRVPQR